MKKVVRITAIAVILLFYFNSNFALYASRHEAHGVFGAIFYWYVVISTFIMAVWFSFREHLPWIEKGILLIIFSYLVLFHYFYYLDDMKRDLISTRTVIVNAILLIMIFVYLVLWIKEKDRED